jgi:hypothetical protein
MTKQPRSPVPPIRPLALAALRSVTGGADTTSTSTSTNLNYMRKSGE